MEIKMDIKTARKLVDALDWDGFIAHFKNTYDELDLYRCGTSWYGNSKYICKIRGTRGDLLITWN